MATDILYYMRGETPSESDIRTRVQAKVNGDIVQAMNVNREGGLRAWIIPEQSGGHLAWNPIRVQCVQFVFDVGDYADIPADALKYNIGTLSGATHYIWAIKTLPTNVTLTICKVDADTEEEQNETILMADTLGGVAEFDIAPFVRTWFGECAEPADGQVYAVDYSMFCQFRIKNAERYSGTPWMALNGVAQVGEPTNIVTGYTASGIKMNRQTAFIRFDDAAGSIPFVCATAGSSRARYRLTEGGVATDYYIEPRTAQRIYLRNSNVVDAVNLYLSGADVTYSEQGLCGGVPLRWVGKYGQTEQYIFGQRQFIDREAKTAGLRETYDERGTNRAAYKVTADKTMRVGLENVPKAVFDVLTGIAVSPKIEYYDTERGMWIGLTCKNYEHTEQRDANAFTIEFEFSLPRVNLQFE